jgi:5'-3' exonuclease
MPDRMIPQLNFIQSFCAAMGLVSISKPDTEADDLMGCYVVEARKRGVEVVLATNDKDLFQLVGPLVTVYSTNKTDLKHAKDSHALLGEVEVTRKWEVPPHQIVELLALTGDSVDNIPGIEGIGHKTAANLIREFGTIENLLQHLPRESPNGPIRVGSSIAGRNLPIADQTELSGIHSGPREIRVQDAVTGSATRSREQLRRSGRIAVVSKSLAQRTQKKASRKGRGGRNEEARDGGSIESRARIQRITF